MRLEGVIPKGTVGAWDKGGSDLNTKAQPISESLKNPPSFRVGMNTPEEVPSFLPPTPYTQFHTLPN